MNILCDWLSDRLEIALHHYQLTCLLIMMKVSVVGKYRTSPLVVNPIGGILL